MIGTLRRGSAHRLRAPPASMGVGAFLLAAGVLLVAWMGSVPGPALAAQSRTETGRRTDAHAETPTLEWRQGRLRVSRLPDLTTDEAALEHLESGLTTSLVVRAFVRGADGEVHRSEGWMAVRWDLWDEVFEVATRGALGSGRRQLAGRDALGRWWRQLSLPVPEAGPGTHGVVRLEIDLLPFSRAEEEDARRWVTDALRQEAADATEVTEGLAADGPEPLANVLNLLMATSVRRDPVARWRWRLEVPEVEP